jgi:pectin methylesterase-like acyl-CoA thioesterase
MAVALLLHALVVIASSGAETR